MRRLGFVSLVLFGVAVAGSAHALDWEQIYTQQDVLVSKADVPGSKLTAFRGETVMNAPPDRILYVILDQDHQTEWVGRIRESRMLVEPTPFEYVVYQSYGLPSPMSDRDYVYKGVITRQGEAIHLDMASIEHPGAPDTVGVRAQLVNSSYVLTPQEGGGTKVEVEIMTDPKGSMPAWMVNSIQRAWPRDTLTGIRALIDQDWVGSYPLPPAG